jgi:hypothetical protein
VSPSWSAWAAGLDAEIIKAVERGPIAGLCPGHGQHLHRHDLVTRWSAGQLGLPLADPKAKPRIAEVLAYLKDPDHQPGARGACHVCMPGSSIREEIPV